jgi:hypothetical protein
MATVSTSSGSYQNLERIRQRIDWSPRDFYGDDPNAALRFDELLVELEEESRGIFETLWGDETPLTETGRTDTIQPTSDAALALVYPINDVTKVERKVTIGDDWDTVDADWYTHTEHRLILSDRPNTNTLQHKRRGNTVTDNANRTTWSDFAAKLRVTYNRGFGDSPPQDIQSIQIALIENMLADRKQSQTTAAGSPEEQGQAITNGNIVTEELRSRIADVTTPGLATVSV